MITEKGTLVIGLPEPVSGERIHKDFEISPMMVVDSIDAETYGKGKTEHHAVLYRIASQIRRLGDLPVSQWKTWELTERLIKDLSEVDLIVLVDARHRLEKKLDDLMQRPGNTTEPEATD
jgi:hypothetical protein